MKTKAILLKSSYSAPRLQVVGSIAAVAERLLESIDGEALTVLPGHDLPALVHGDSSRRLH